MAHPGDLSALEALLRAGGIRANDIRAVIGKTEGNGGLNDFTRGYFTQSLMLLLASQTGESPAAFAARIPCVLSGGTEGGLSPHYMVFAVEDEEATGQRSLALGTSFTNTTPARDIGRDAQITDVMEATWSAMGRAGIGRVEDVVLVQVKAPAPSAPDPAARSQDAKALMALSRAAAALCGVRARRDPG